MINIEREQLRIARQILKQRSCADITCRAHGLFASMQEVDCPFVDIPEICTDCIYTGEDVERVESWIKAQEDLLENSLPECKIRELFEMFDTPNTFKKDEFDNYLDQSVHNIFVGFRHWYLEEARKWN